jgi:hypothetical protein
MDTVSSGGFLQFSAGGILPPVPGELARDSGPCDYDMHNDLNAPYVYRLSGTGSKRLAAYSHR